jgi:putative endonuclease
MMTNANRTVLYVGVTSDLVKRVYQHNHHLMSNAFTSKYQCHLLVWYEQHLNIEDAIMREKQLKSGNRKTKLQLIEQFNPHWKDLYDNIF